MKKEKNIYERKSTVKGKEDETVAYVVQIPYYEQTDGTKKRKQYVKNFPVKDYVTPAAALKNAIRERDRMTPLLKSIQSINYDSSMDYSAEEILSLLPNGMRMVILNEMEKKATSDSSFENHTVQELFDLIPKHFKKRKNTQKHMWHQYKGYIKDDYGDKLITDITVTDVLDSLTKCAEKCAQDYVSKLKSLWGKIFDVALMCGIPVTDWSEIIDLPASDKHTERSLTEQNITEEDFQKFCTFMSHYGNYAPIQTKQIFRRDIVLYMIRLIRITGIRLAEAKALSRSCITFRTVQIDGENGLEHVEIADIAIKSEMGSTLTQRDVIRETKTPQSVRTLPVTPEGAKILREVMAYHDYDILFCDADGSLLKTSVVDSLLANVSKKCGIKVYTLLLRKSFSADLYANGVNPAVTKRLMGHKNEDMSLNAYASASDKDTFDVMMNRKYKK